MSNLTHYIVSWWNGEIDVWAANETSAKKIVADGCIEYRAYGRSAPLFCKELEVAK